MEGMGMSTKAVVIWVVVIAAFLGATFAFRGEGHRMLAKWMPAMHGGSR
jgi:hypothetical protein